MDSDFPDDLLRLRDAGVISDEEFRAALFRKIPQVKPKSPRRLVRRIVVAAAVAIPAFLLFILNASFPVWLTTGIVIFAAAMLAPHAIKDNGD